MSTTKTTLPISEVRKRLFEITDKVQMPGVAYTLTEKGRPKAVIISAEEFESLMETLEVMQEIPTIVEDAKQAKADFVSGKYKEYMTLEQLIAQRAAYDVSNLPATKGKKRSRAASRA